MLVFHAGGLGSVACRRRIGDGAGNAHVFDDRAKLSGDYLAGTQHSAAHVVRVKAYNGGFHADVAFTAVKYHVYPPVHIMQNVLR